MSNPFAHLRTDYRVIAADPPWKFKSNSAAKPGRNAMGHYACMSLADIAALPVASIAAPNAMLLLWITGPFMAIGAHLALMKAWGFKPSGMGFVWIKLNPKAPQLFFMEQDLATGGGFTTRKNAEFCVIGKKGRSVRQDAGIHEVIIEPRRQHSRKPDKFYSRAEQYSEGPRIEMFARESRKNWDSWGNQATKFDEVAA